MKGLDNMFMYPTIQRKSDNKIFYFRDEESRDEFLDIHDGEEFINFKYVLNVPFGEEIFDCDSQREDLEVLLKITGLSQNNVEITSDILYNTIDNNDFNHTDERLEQAREQYNIVYTMDNNELIKTDENPDEIVIRKNKLLNLQIFQTFYDSLNDQEKNIVAQAFKEKQLDIDNLNEYINQEINMDIEPLVTKFKSKYQLNKALKKYKESKEYKHHKNVLDAIDLAYEKIHNLHNNK